MAQADTGHGGRWSVASLARTLTACVLLGGTTGCLQGESGGNGVTVEVGIPDPETQSGFVPLEPGGDVMVDTFGQGGYHAEVSIAFQGLGDAVYPVIVIENLDDGEGEIDTPRPPRAQPVACDETGYCIDSRIFVMLGGLADVDDLDGLRVRITAIVDNDDGLSGEGSREAVLRRVER